MKFCTSCGKPLIDFEARPRNAAEAAPAPPPHDHYPQAAPYAAPVSGKATVSLVLGIVSAATSWLWFGMIGLALGIVGLVIAISARKQTPSGVATAGFVLSIIGITVSGSLLIKWAWCMGTILPVAYGCSRLF